MDACLVQDIFIGKYWGIKSKCKCYGITGPGINDFLNFVPLADNAGIKNSIHQFVDNNLSYGYAKPFREIPEQIVGQRTRWGDVFFHRYGDRLGFKGPYNYRERSLAIHFIKDKGIGPVLG